MKLFLSLSLLIVAQIGNAQVSLLNLRSDPSRAKATSNTNAREESLNDIDYEDALQLPFFEDFTSVGPSIERITTIAEANVVITTYQPHGFITPTNIVISNMEGLDTADYLNGNWYAKPVSKNDFEIYSDQAATNAVKGKGKPVDEEKIGHYTVVGLEFGPNPDPFKWVKSNNVYVNNRFAVNPPTKYTATFDGLDSKGLRYITSDAAGWGDTLTSRKIDLSTLNTENDNAYFSFWWQVGGYLDRPESTDILKLEFKTRSGTWEMIKEYTGGQFIEEAKLFNYELIKIDPTYFHNSFQFRFENYGRVSGFYDAWHLDYFLIDKNRETDTSRYATNEGAVVSLQQSALKEYSAMPINQVSSQSLSNEVSLAIRNISNSPRTFNLPFTLSLNNNLLLQSDLRSTSEAALNEREFRELKGNINVANINLPTLTEKSILKYTVAADFSDPSSQRLNFLRNNNDSTFTILDDYFAYDDGTSERVLETRQPQRSLWNQAVVVSKFVLNNPDRLVGIDMNFPKVGFNLAESNYNLRIKVYADNNGVPGAELDNSKETIRLIQESDSTKLETFEGYTLQFPLDLPAGPFFIGFQHEGSTTLSYIGVDMNTLNTGNQFYRLSNAQSWVGTTFAGTLMIRPVFQAGKVNSTQAAQKGTLTCEVYPNPSNGQIHIVGDVLSANLYDASGKLIQTELYNSSESKSIGSSDLLPGFYFLHLENDYLKAIKKVVIIK